jgi:hypothetical protein
MFREVINAAVQAISICIRATTCHKTKGPFIVVNSTHDKPVH